MPYISMELIPQSTEVKDRLVVELPRLASQITGIPAEFFLMTIKELPPENFGFHGESLRDFLAKMPKKE